MAAGSTVGPSQSKDRGDRADLLPLARGVRGLRETTKAKSAGRSHCPRRKRPSLLLEIAPDVSAASDKITVHGHWRGPWHPDMSLQRSL